MNIGIISKKGYTLTKSAESLCSLLKINSILHVDGPALPKVHPMTSLNTLMIHSACDAPKHAVRNRTAILDMCLKTGRKNSVVYVIALILRQSLSYLRMNLKKKGIKTT